MVWPGIYAARRQRVKLWRVARGRRSPGDAPVLDAARGLVGDGATGERLHDVNGHVNRTATRPALRGGNPAEARSSDRAGRPGTAPPALDFRAGAGRLETGEAP